ncbi:MAG: hypothetical protein B0W54_01245 [Cellvibrio sp. 79]|nr:MAG: hypothetical protein B0W54_01245 [Cellvibrio sp. 79]
MRIDFHINFSGQCQDAFEFYQSLLGGEVELLTYGNSPAQDDVPADWAGKIVHGSFRFNNLQIAGADLLPESYQKLQGFQLLLQLSSSSEAQRIFDALAAGGVVTMPLQKTFWTDAYGMVTDRFGVPWEVNANDEVD